MNHQLKEKLLALFQSNTPLLQIVEELRSLRDGGVKKEEVSQTLQLLRQAADDEALEDRILEVMDFVEGFCHADNRIW